MQQVTRRAWRRLSTNAFASDLAASELCGDLTALDDQTVDELVQLYNQVTTALLDRHCPTVTVHRQSTRRRHHGLTPTVVQLAAVQEQPRDGSSARSLIPTIRCGLRI